uniref:Uncharacterized protein n=1 Tax=Saccharomyces cerevisiae TaxID=4932 RepID=E9PAB4_YEASX|nr:unknown protein [Saccharomyces cerevisiae]
MHTPTTNTATKHSNILMNLIDDAPGLYVNIIKNTSTTVMATPAGRGTLIRIFKAIAVPITSAISVAITAHSAKKYNVQLSHRGKYSLQARLRSSPVTEPNLIHRHCKNMAIKFDNKMIQSREN